MSSLVEHHALPSLTNGYYQGFGPVFIVGLGCDSRQAPDSLPVSRNSIRECFYGPPSLPLGEAECRDGR